MNIRSLFYRHPLIAFIVLVYGIFWLPWMIADLGEAPALFLNWLGRGSILLAALFHGVYDLMVMYSSAALPFIRQTRGMETIVLLGMAAVIVVIYGSRHFRRGQTGHPNRDE